MADQRPLEAQIEELLPVFLPYARERRRAMANGRFVHYTTAGNGLKIIQSKQLWLRDTRCMNDYSEVVHGFSVLEKWFTASTNGADFSASLDSLGKDIATDALNMFFDWWRHLPASTYIFSMSEHLG